MSENRVGYAVRPMCRLLEVSASGFYAWRNRAPSARDRRDAELLDAVRAIHATSRGTYGVPRVHAELRARGVCIGRKRVGRLMRAAGLQGVSRRREFATTVRDPEARTAPDLVNRNFRVSTPNRLWVADITYIGTPVGFLYLAVVLDAWSRRVVGWAMATRLCKQIVLDALAMAVRQRQPRDVIHHSDHGSQYTSIAFGERCRLAGVRPSMGSVGDCYDNAMCESFFASLECELLDRKRFASPAQARAEVFSYIEGFYNPHRRHSSIGYLSPANVEKCHAGRARGDAGVEGRAPRDGAGTAGHTEPAPRRPPSMGSRRRCASSAAASPSQEARP